MPLKQNVKTLAQRNSQFEAPRHPQGWRCCPAAAESSAACAWGRAGAARARLPRAARPGACAVAAWGASLMCLRTLLQSKHTTSELTSYSNVPCAWGDNAAGARPVGCAALPGGDVCQNLPCRRKGMGLSLVEDPVSAPGNEQSNVAPPNLASTGACALQVDLDLCCRTQSTCGSPKKWRALIKGVDYHEAYLHPCHSHRCSSQLARQPPLLQSPLHQGIASYRRNQRIGLHASQQPQSQTLAALSARDTTAAQRLLLTIVLHLSLSPTCLHRTPGHPCKKPTNII